MFSTFRHRVAAGDLFHGASFAVGTLPATFELPSYQNLFRKVMGVPAPDCNDAHLLCTAILTGRMLGIQSLAVFLRVMAIAVVHRVSVMDIPSNGREVK